MKIRKAIVRPIFRNIGLLWLFLCSNLTYSQNSLLEDVWFNGEIFFVDNTSDIGKLKYDFASNSVVLKVKGEVAVYNPAQFDKVIFSVDSTKTRELIIRSKENSKGFQEALLFEELVTGGVTLLSREQIVYYSTGTMASQGFRSEILPLLVYNYYFQKNSGSIISFNNNKRNVMKIMKSHSEVIKTYVKENKLRYSQKNDLIKIFEYYNKINKL